MEPSFSPVNRTQSLARNTGASLEDRPNAENPLVLMSGPTNGRAIAHAAEATSTPVTPRFAGSPAIDFNSTTAAFAGVSDTGLWMRRAIFQVMANPTLSNALQHLADFSVRYNLPLARAAIRNTIFEIFCGGEELPSAIERATKLHAQNVTGIIDYAVEGEKTESGFDATFHELNRAISETRHNPAVSFVAIKLTGLGDSALMEKRQQHGDGTLTADERAAFGRLTNRFNELVKNAATSDVKVFVDAEETWIQGTIDELTHAAMARHNRERPIVFTTAQLYRHDRLDFVTREIAAAREEGFIFALKVVRGAYLEKERARAEKNGEPSPINPTKAETDRLYNATLKVCLDNIDVTSVVAATHNDASCVHLIRLLQERNIAPNDPRISFAQLLGMSDNISFNLAANGYNVAKYIPYGPVAAVLPYLSRRAKENSSINGQMPRELVLIRTEQARRRN